MKRMLKQYKLIAFPIFISLFLGVAAWLVIHKLEADTRSKLGEYLSMQINTTHQSVGSWLEQHMRDAMVWGNTPEVRMYTVQLLATQHTSTTLVESQAQMELRHRLLPVHTSKGYQGYFIIGPGNINLASSHDSNIGVKNLLSGQQEFMQKVWAGQAAVSLPIRSDVLLPDSTGYPHEGQPTMFVGAPIMNNAGEVIAVFLFRLNPLGDFTKVLQQGRPGKTGEIIAFDRNGILISESRFADKFYTTDYFYKKPDTHGIFDIQLRDPGVNIVAGESNYTLWAQQPLTRMAAQATAGKSGLSLEAYNDYRGVPVVGAWVWDPELGFGIAVEQDAGEAYQAFYSTRYVIVGLAIFLILLFSGLMLIVFVYRQHRQAQAALQESEEKYRTIFNSESDLLFVCDPKTGRILDANDAVSQMYGYSREELLHMTVYDVSAEPEKTKMAISLGTPTRISERYHKKKDGTIFPVEITQSPFEFREKRLLVGAVRDITKRKQAEEDLRESEERLRLLVEQADFLLWSIDRNLTFTQSLGGGLNNLGLRANEVVGMTLYQYFKTESLEFPPIKAHLQALDGNQAHYDFEWQDRDFQTQIAPQYDVNGKVIGCIGVAVDTTYRKQVEKNLCRSEVFELLATGASLNKILTALAVSVEKHDPEILCSILLLDEDGKYLRQGSAPNLPDFFNEAIDGVAIGSEVASCGAAAYTGERFIVEDIMAHPNWMDFRTLADKAGLRACWSEPVISSQGKVLGTFASYYREPRVPQQQELDFIQDSTRLAAIAIERKQAEAKKQQLLQQNRDLTQRMFRVQEEERRHLARELHDEFGQWLTGIHINAEIIRQLNEGKDEGIHATAQVIEESATEMHKNIRGMIRQLRPTLLDELGLVESLKELVNQWQAKHPAVGITLSLDGDLDDLGDNLNITIYRIIQESLTNVAKYAEARDVAVELTRQPWKAGEQDSLLLSVEDNGKGMDRSNHTDGMGLPGMRERVLAAGGEFTIHSSPGEGVHIEVSIPIN